MNILVIGNGFDLAHELPTTYGDFLEFVGVYENNVKLICSGQEIRDTFIKLSDRQQDILLYLSILYEQNNQLFSELGKCIFQNRWLQYFKRVYKEKFSDGKSGWIDFESEISSCIQRLNTVEKYFMQQIKEKDDPIFLPTKMKKLLPAFTENDVKQNENIVSLSKDYFTLKMALLNDLNRLTRCLEIYLSGYVKQKKIEKTLPDISEITEKKNLNAVLSFNYTDTFKTVYGSLTSNHIQYDYIHGKADMAHSIDTCNLVLGIDEYLDEDTRDNDTAYIEFKKFYQRIFKKTGCVYVDWINLMKSRDLHAPSNNVYVFGHSLDTTDRDVLSQLINTPNTNTTIFYHSRESLGKLISNMVRLIGETELIKRVHGNAATIIFKEQKC